MGGHSQTYHHVDVGLAGICTVIVCKAHGHAKHANTRGAGSMPPLGKLHALSEIKSDSIFSDLSPFNAPVDIGTQNL